MASIWKKANSASTSMVAKDFRTDFRPRDNAIFNAPYRDNKVFIEHAFEVARYRVAALVRIPFLCGQERFHTLFTAVPPELVLILGERPSMPPGDSNSPAKNGTADYCWSVWPDRGQRQRGGYRTMLVWAPPQALARRSWLQRSARGESVIRAGLVETLPTEKRPIL